MNQNKIKLDNNISLLENSKQYIINGVKKMNIFDSPNHFPTFFSNANGPYVWDIDNNKYIDLISGKGSVILGYANNEVDHAVIDVIRSGSIFPLTSSLYSKLAKMLCNTIDSIERVKFFKTGSCAVSAAIRLAKKYNDRKIILTCGYHGWHDWFIENRSSWSKNASEVIDFYYNIDLLEKIVKEKNKKISAIVVTPEPNFLGADFLRKIQDISKKYNIVFILDEIKTGFRFRVEGYQSLIKINPDLSTFSKAIANGYPLSVLGGKKEIMLLENVT